MPGIKKVRNLSLNSTVYEFTSKPVNHTSPVAAEYNHNQLN